MSKIDPAAYGKSSTETARIYDRLSGWYDLLSGPAEKKLRQAGLQRLGLSTGEHLLEIGPGTGSSLVDAARQVSSTDQIVGMDLSWGMCRASQQRIEREIIAGTTVSILQGDALCLPFGKGCFDAVFMSFTFELFPTGAFPIVLDEIRRVSNTESRLGIVSLVKVDPQSWMERAYTWLHERFPALLDCRPIALDQILSENGFSLVSYEIRSMFGLPVALAVCK